MVGVTGSIPVAPTTSPTATRFRTCLQQILLRLPLRTFSRWRLRAVERGARRLVARRRKPGSSASASLHTTQLLPERSDGPRASVPIPLPKTVKNRDVFDELPGMGLHACFGRRYRDRGPCPATDECDASRRAKPIPAFAGMTEVGAVARSCEHEALGPGFRRDDAESGRSRNSVYAMKPAAFTFLISSRTRAASSNSRSRACWYICCSSFLSFAASCAGLSAA